MTEDLFFSLSFLQSVSQLVTKKSKAKCKISDESHVECKCYIMYTFLLVYKFLLNYKFSPPSPLIFTETKTCSVIYGTQRCFDYVFSARSWSYLFREFCIRILGSFRVLHRLASKLQFTVFTYFHLPPSTPKSFCWSVCYQSAFKILTGVRDDTVVGGTALRARSSQVRFPIGLTGIFTVYFQPRYGTGVDSASNKSECKEYLLAGKGGRCVGLKILNQLHRNLGGLNLLENWRLFRACTGIILSFFKV